MTQFSTDRFDLKECPKELLANRKVIEGNFVMCLWKDPDLYGDYSEFNAKNDLLSFDAKFFYAIGKAMYDLGYNSFDEATISMYLDSKPSLRKGFNDRQGYRTVQKATSILDIDNIETYYDELVRSNMLIDLHFDGFSIVSNLDKLLQMTSDEIYDYFDYKLNRIALKRTTSMTVEDLVLTIDFIEEMNEGLEIGLQYGASCPRLNYITMGIPKSALTMVASNSGGGKTSFLLANVVIPIINNGHKCCIISNEQKSNEFKQILTAMILAKKLNYYGLDRKRVKAGDYSKEQLEQLLRAVEISQKEHLGKLKFIRMFDYNVGKIKRAVRKLAKEGFELFMYDTMKSEDLADGQFWQSLVETSKELFQLASKEDVALVTSYQLAPSQINKRYLDVMSLSNAKQIKEVYSEMIYFREVWEDEYFGEKNDIQPYNYRRGDDGEVIRAKDDETGKYHIVKDYIELDRDCKHIVAFVDKTRNDERGQNIVYKFNGAYNIWEEIGYCTVKHDRGI